MEIAADIILSVNEMFVGLSRHARFEATSTFMNLRQKKRQPVREHMMKSIAYLNKLKILGIEIDGETKNHMVLNTLLDTFSQFKIDYELNKKDYTLAALMKDLQITENIIKTKTQYPWKLIWMWVLLLLNLMQKQRERIRSSIIRRRDMDLKHLKRKILRNLLLVKET